jgi:hypothetical protein
LVPSMRGWAFSKDPLLSTIKGGSLLLIWRTTHKTRKCKARARASPLHGLRP